MSRFNNVMKLNSNTPKQTTIYNYQTLSLITSTMNSTRRLVSAPAVQRQFIRRFATEKQINHGTVQEGSGFTANRTTFADAPLGSTGGKGPATPVMTKFNWNYVLLGAAVAIPVYWFYGRKNLHPHAKESQIDAPIRPATSSPTLQGADTRLETAAAPQSKKNY